jgi:myo-inositol 2-dehydrogenase/D-chiro-inositol 1-dehydrogenase
METKENGVPRRDLVKGAAVAGAVLGSLPLVGLKAQGGNKKLKVGLIGAGGRASGAINDHMEAVKTINDKLSLGLEVTLVAACDFEKGKAAGTAKKYGCAGEKCYDGADGYKKVIESGCDIIITAVPPAFRPLHFETAIKAGKHVFFEKPVAVDPNGIRRVIAAGEEAKKKGLNVVAGTQRRHSTGYNERWQAIKEGQYGRIMGGRVSWCMGKIFSNSPINPKTPGDLAGGGKWQLWVEMSGDHICEQHVHNLDIANWYLQSHPLSARGFGWRARRVAGNMYDHFSVDLEYPNGIHIHSMCRQVGGCWDWVGEEFTYEKQGGKPKEPIPYAEMPRKGNDYVDEHIHLLMSIVQGKEPINEAQNVAWATGAAILGREAAYSGQQITWADMFENKGSPWYNLKMKPQPEDFETGNVEYPKDGDIRIPGKG